MQSMIYVGIGGFIGACLRYAVSLYSSKMLGTQFPYGTLIVNITGGILIGLIMELSFNTDLIPPNMRLFLTTGIMGGLTTFSTFSYETINLLSDGEYLIGVLNICLNVFLSLFGVIAGRSIAHFI